MQRTLGGLSLMVLAAGITGSPPSRLPPGDVVEGDALCDPGEALSRPSRPAIASIRSTSTQRFATRSPRYRSHRSFRIRDPELSKLACCFLCPRTPRSTA
ncbi:MAG: hypothetical protein Ct9H300mP1_11120 [Planctomycetaceae bacterium]|nr:MAG: hypothetical protein Ct9H300mP1_11120 [Planctomycetaceae bacterium]